MGGRAREAREACFGANKDECGAFARAVATKFGVTLHGLANEIVQPLRDGPRQTLLSAQERAMAATKHLLPLVIGIALTLGGCGT
jgi:hypothetical protein